MRTRLLGGMLPTLGHEEHSRLVVDIVVRAHDYHADCKVACPSCTHSTSPLDAKYAFIDR